MAAVRKKKASKATTPSQTFSPGDVRRVLLEHRFLLKADRLCAKWQISRATLRAWKKSGQFEYLAGDLRELVIAGLAGSKTPATLRALAEWTSYQDHAGYSDAELRAVIDGLVAEGIAACTSSEDRRGLCAVAGEARLDVRLLIDGKSRRRRAHLVGASAW